MYVEIWDDIDILKDVKMISFLALSFATLEKVDLALCHHLGGAVDGQTSDVVWGPGSIRLVELVPQSCEILKDCCLLTSYSFVMGQCSSSWVWLIVCPIICSPSHVVRALVELYIVPIGTSG